MLANCDGFLEFWDAPGVEKKDNRKEIVSRKRKDSGEVKDFKF